MRHGSGRFSSMKSWLAISLLIPKKAGEAISNFLMEWGATGIEEVDENSTWEWLKTYFLQDGKEREVLRALHQYLESLERIDPEISRIQIETTSIPEQDWGENWKRFFKPIRVGSQFVVKPPWSKTSLKKGEIPIIINPGMAFGIGTHSTTKLCMEALEERLQKKGVSVLDVGTGSGILSIAAARLGAGEVWGLDIDGLAVETARENVSRNHVSDIVRIKKGRIRDVWKRFDVVVANIDLKNLKRMRMTFIKHLKRHGLLILSGILEGEEGRLCQLYMKTGLLQWIESSQEEEWVCLTFMKK